MNSVVRVQLIAALLLGVTGQKALSQNIVHTLIWDRFWLSTNNSLTLSVLYGDRLQLLCQVNVSSEAVGDQYENLIVLQDEQEADECSTTPDTAVFIDYCRFDGYDISLDVRDRPLATHSFRFEAGRVYYFTSFSTGTPDSAQTSRTEGGACESMPPLKLTVSVAPVMATTTSRVEPTSSSSHITSVATTSSSSGSTTSTVMTATPPPTDPTTDRSTDSATGPVRIGRSERVVPSCFVILLIATAVYLIM